MDAEDIKELQRLETILEEYEANGGYKFSSEDFLSAARLAVKYGWIYDDLCD